MPIYEWNEDLHLVECRPESLPYRSKWACFACRKAFTRKRQSVGDAVACPDCGDSATDMGYLFEPPPKRDRKSWAVMKVLGKNGLVFHKAASKPYINRFITDGNTLSPSQVQARIDELVAAYNKRRWARRRD